MYYISIITLWTGEAVGGPAEGMSIRAQESVLLLHTEPRVVILHHAHDLCTGVALIGLCRNNDRDQLK